MRKAILFTVALGTGLSAAAQQGVTPLPLATPKAARAYEAPSEPAFSQVYGQPSSNVRQGNPAALITTEAVIGTTIYTLQTNSTVKQHTVALPNGHVAASWTWSNGAWNSWADRGTGYNYYDGSAWGAQPSTRLENGRTGFNTNVVIGTGNGTAEMNVAHNTSSLAQHFVVRTGVGTGTWTDNTSLIPAPSGFTFGTWWPAMAVGGTNGDVIHHIALTAPTGLASGGGPYTNGQDGAILYARSNDGGATFGVANMILPGTHPQQSAGWGGDAYDIAARGNTVAVVAGGFAEDVVLCKSSDGGVTWDSTIVHDFPLTPWTDQLSDTNSDGLADTLETNDASLAVYIDNNNMCHVVYGQMFILNDVAGDGNMSYFPGTAALMYWREGMTAPVVMTGAEDLNSNGTLDITDFGTYQVSLVSHPSIGTDGGANIYVAFDAIMEGSDDGTGKSFRNVYVMASADNGSTWSAPYNISEDLTYEKVYPSISEWNYNGVLSITYQRDQVAGHGVSTTGVDPDNVGVTHEIIYAAVPVADIVSGVSEPNTVFNQVDVYPNPANDNATLMINLDEASEVTITMYNSMGQVVSSDNKNLVMGTNNVALDVENLAAGVYFINVQQGTSKVSKKLVIE